jgi:hypothetical protein
MPRYSRKPAYTLASGHSSFERLFSISEVRASSLNCLGEGPSRRGKDATKNVLNASRPGLAREGMQKTRNHVKIMSISDLINEWVKVQHN